ncbi:MAG TPA: YkgJ family cysteine cluster protein [Kofleriaceae bacterium]|nr:YkgJ family cysteine cluster protein [Kofleriaceae bacterium]
MSAYRPKLRSYLRLEGGELIDGLLDRTMEIEGTAAALAARLDGTCEWDAIRAGLLAEGHDAGEVDGALRVLMLLHYVEGAGDELAAKLEAIISHREEVPTVILEEARFECQGSGSCCSAYAFGPLSAEDTAVLDRLDLAGALSGVEPPYVVERDDGRYLRSVDGSCVFLSADGKCGIHRAFGSEAKPHFCRLYPYDSFGTVEGVRVVDRGACAKFAVSARRGLPLYDDLARVRPLAGAPVLHHPIVLVDDRAWDHGLFLRFTGVATELARHGVGTVFDTLHAIGRWLDAMSVALGRCPLEPGQPDAMASTVLGMDAAFWFRPPRPEPAVRGLKKLTELIEEIAASVAAAIDEGRARASTPRFRDFRVAADRVSAWLAAADARTVLAPTAAPGLAGDVDETLRISLRQQLFGRHVLAGQYAGAGLVRIGLILLFSLAGARHDAGDRPIAAAELSRGHMIATRTFQTHALDELLGDHDGAWRTLLDGIWVAARLFARA